MAASVKVVLTRGDGDTLAPVEYDGHCALVAGPAHVSGAIESVLESIIKLSSASAEGAELLRVMQRPNHVQCLSISDHSCLLPARFTSLPRVGRVSSSATSSAARGSTPTATPARDSMLPECMWSSDAGAWVAEGMGTLRDALTGATLYHGTWRCGMRHGAGKATLYTRGSGGDAPAVLQGEYEGDWVLGLRHGRGTLTEDCGDRYEGQWALDAPHGQGVLLSAGGGMFKGNWYRGRKHGCGVFTWPLSARLELRQYEHGECVAVRAAAEPPRVASTVSLANLHTAGAMLRRSASGNTLPALLEEQEYSLGLSIDAHADALAAATAAAAAVGGMTASAGATASSLNLVGAVPHPATRYNAGILRFLKHTSVNDIPGGRTAAGELLKVNLSDTVESCITRMTESNVLSVPVFDPSKGMYVAIIHILDIFGFMLDLVAKKKASFSPSGASLRETLAHQRRFAAAPIAEVLEMSSHISPPVFKPLPLGAPLMFAVQILAEGTHAVPILDTSGGIVRMLTQADVVRFLAAHLDELHPMGSMTIGELGLGAGDPERLVVARFTDKTFDILQALRAKQAPAAPVVDTYGAMAANISFSDVKAIARKANFSALQLPISQFFTSIEKGAEVMSPSIYVKASTQFQSMVLTLAATKIHQLYFVDDALHPVGCVRVGDILKALIREDDA